MANILELASYLANINESTSENILNDPSCTEDFAEPYSTEVQAPETDSLDSSNPSLEENLYTALTTLSQSINSTSHSHLISSSPNNDTVSASKSFANHDDSFNNFVNGFANSPLSPKDIEAGIINFLDEIAQKDSTNPTINLSSNCSSDSGVCLSNDISLSSVCNQNSVLGYNSSVNDSLDSSLSSTSCHQRRDSGTCNTTDNTNINSTDFDHKRPDISYVELIAKCILATSKNKVALSEIYDYILNTYPYFENAPPAWRISVRHHLSTCESFIKIGRVPLSRGFYWAIHPACKEDFKDGIFDRKLMRKRLGKIKPCKRAKKIENDKPNICNTIKIECKEKSTEDQLTKAINNIPMSPRLGSPFVPTTAAVNSQQHQMLYQSYYNSNKLYFDPYNTVYSRPCGLTDQEQCYQFSTQNRNNTSVQHNNLTGQQTNYYYGNCHNTRPYCGNNSNYTSVGGDFHYRLAQHPGYSSEHYYNSANYPSISVPYGHQPLSGKTSQQSSSRYLPY